MNSHRTVKAPMLEVFRQDLGNAVVFRVGPEMRVEPGKLIQSHPAQRKTQYVSVGIEHGKLGHKLFGAEFSLVSWQ